MRTRSRRLGVVVVAAALALTACSSPTVTMTPAPDANNPGCAPVMVRMPDQLGDYDLRTTDAQATAAWGTPTVALLSCGVPVPEVSELPCVQIDGIYWLREELTDSGDADYAFTTYGTDPAVRLVVDNDQLAAGIALDNLGLALSFLPTNGRQCTSLENTVTGSE